MGAARRSLERERRFVVELAQSRPGIRLAEVAGLEPSVFAVTLEQLEHEGRVESWG